MKLSRLQLFWLLQIAGWTFFTSINLWFNYATRGYLKATDYIYATAIVVIGIVFSSLIRWHFRRYQLYNKGIFTLLKGIFLNSIFLGWLNVLILYYFGQVCDEAILRGFDRTSFIFLTASFSIIYFIWSLLYFAIYFFRNFKKEEIKNLTFQAQIKEVSLNKFKSQLNPHFMFNSMNVIRALVDEDKEKAKIGITKLSNILRQTLNLDQKKLISLQEEMKLVNDYLDLEKMRFEERLGIKIDVVDEANKYLVPPMLVQTLVENSIKHGISSQMNGGTIELKGSVNENRLVLSIEHPGNFKPSPNSGHGLKNSKQRLQLIFKGDASLDITNSQENRVITTLIIPEV